MKVIYKTVCLFVCLFGAYMFIFITTAGLQKPEKTSFPFCRNNIYFWGVISNFLINEDVAISTTIAIFFFRCLIKLSSDFDETGLSVSLWNGGGGGNILRMEIIEKPNMGD